MARYYKNKYYIVFYDESDEVFLHIFDNVREILKYQGRECTRQNVNLVNVELYRALKSESHITKFLDNTKTRVYIIDREENDDE